jgi:hypothetical protein
VSKVHRAFFTAFGLHSHPDTGPADLGMVTEPAYPAFPMIAIPRFLIHLWAPLGNGAYVTCPVRQGRGKANVLR